MSDARLLTLAQWLSPAYPLSAYAYSHGLESAVADGHVRDGAGLTAWLGDVLECGSGRSDAIWLRLAYRAEDSAVLRDLDGWARAFAPSAERLEEAANQGAAFARTTSRVWRIDVPEALLPLAVGRATRLAEIDIEAAVPFFLHAFAGNMVAAAQRLMPLGQTEGQVILAGLHPLCLRIGCETRGAELCDISGTAFLSDIASMRHEARETRMFRS